mmetsp:Transcript_18362/g.69509  ORF Transcript_18362/g.69509 Transcript_18362/m.69509 type:complete len:346 (+) Transcript_18362:715-1752(+)
MSGGLPGLCSGGRGSEPTPRVSAGTVHACRSRVGVSANWLAQLDSWRSAQSARLVLWGARCPAETVSQRVSRPSGARPARRSQRWSRMHTLSRPPLRGSERGPVRGSTRRMPWKSCLAGPPITSTSPLARRNSRGLAPAALGSPSNTSSSAVAPTDTVTSGAPSRSADGASHVLWWGAVPPLPASKKEHSQTSAAIDAGSRTPAQAASPAAASAAHSLASRWSAGGRAGAGALSRCERRGSKSLRRGFQLCPKCIVRQRMEQPSASAAGNPPSPAPSAAAAWAMTTCAASGTNSRRMTRPGMASSTLRGRGQRAKAPCARAASSAASEGPGSGAGTGAAEPDDTS